MKYQEGLDKEVLSRGFGGSFFRRTQVSTNLFRSLTRETPCFNNFEGTCANRRVPLESPEALVERG